MVEEEPVHEHVAQRCERCRGVLARPGHGTGQATGEGCHLRSDLTTSSEGQTQKEGLTLRSKVHVLLDWVGSVKMEDSLVPVMAQAGVQVRRFHPPHWSHLGRLNNRTHRRLLIVDVLKRGVKLRIVLPGKRIDCDAVRGASRTTWGRCSAPVPPSDHGPRVQSRAGSPGELCEVAGQARTRVVRRVVGFGDRRQTSEMSAQPHRPG